ncbi:MAG: transketolase [Thiohalocapsa sp.]|jgi:transketolase|uniref:transketolase n=1 Tax=Thiohalocapsa sp. TaxID=2497641 RepID=UPI0025F67F07|nr:transketolase [Thiohalocapsa sp.]MCG6941507.1 transketolase [Thiohalocapsa sp.]
MATSESTSPLARLHNHGQCYWLDSLSRRMLDDGSLQRRIREQGLSGITSNPAIFAKAMLGSSPADRAAYDRRILVAQQATSPGDAEIDVHAIYERLAVDDVRDACDLFLPRWEECMNDGVGVDGCVSLEVSPHLAHDTDGTIAEARRLWQAVGRPNLLIKVPGTSQGIPAIETLLAEGINVNITLLFGLHAYEDTLQAYLRAQERRLREGRDLHHVGSVASFFLSRIDVAVDARLRHRIQPEVDASIRDEAEALMNRSAVAAARLAYARLREVLESERWQNLAEHGAQPQRVLWASTGIKDPSLSDVHYIEPLIGPYTVSTMPEATADAFDDHGQVAATLSETAPQAEATVERVEQLLGIDMESVADQLVGEGVQKFNDPYEQLLEGLAERTRELVAVDNAGPLAAEAARLRAEVLRMTTTAGSGHATSCLSCADIVSALFFHEMRWDPGHPWAGHDSDGGPARDQDRFLLSKGHAAPILWAVLHEAGAIDDDIMTLRQLHSDLEGHPTPLNPWVPVATGSLGQGLAAVNGMAVADRLDGIEARHFCLLGDGECSEGSVWESAQFAADHKLERVVAIVDMNGLEQSGPSPYGHDSAVLAGRFKAFGWRTIEIDGHDYADILAALAATREPGPTAIIARTVKGKGVSFLEGAEGWHGKALDPDQLGPALAEINAPDKVCMQVEPRRVPAGMQPAVTMRIGGEGAQAPAQLELPWNIGDEVATRTAFGDALVQLGEAYGDLVVLDGDVKNSTRTQGFADKFPRRFVEGQIAEQNLFGAALGLAASGKRPCVATFSAFLTRAYDFIRMAVHSRAPHMLVCGSHAGVSIGQDGASQMGLEDIAMFRALDAATVLYPCDAVSAANLTAAALAHPGIVYLRTTRGKTPVIYGPGEEFQIGGSKTFDATDEDELTLVAAGITVHTALLAAKRLREQGLRTRVIDAYSVKPLDVATLKEAIEITGTLLVVEDHNRDGGLGDAVAAQVGRLGRVFHVGVAGEPHSATPEELLERHRLSGEQIEREALAVAA